MTLLAGALLLWLAGAAGGALLGRRPAGVVVGAAGALGGAVLLALAGILALRAAPALWAFPWSLPGGGLRLRLDPLAAIFLLPIAAVGGPCAIYGLAYQRRHHPGAGRAGAAWLVPYDLLLASMALVVAADDLLLLLIGWELMTLASWALVVHDHEDRSVRASGLQYLVASHVATGALLLLALALAVGAGSFQIGALAARPALLPQGVLFVLLLVGFGTKAGIVPLHVWLPDAHPAAPSHVSALMSAVMVTMGIYGLARFLPLLGAPHAWWAYALLLLGAAGAVGAVLLALAQRDVKRLLAYSTVENAGIMIMAIGLGVLGSAQGRPVLAALGWTAAFLHVWNHALVKAVLFLGFGALAQAAGSRSLDAIGGMLARWRLVGAVLVLAAGAIASLPGLNVFTSEWLLLRGLLAAGLELAGLPRVFVLGGVVALSLAGALAVACFVRLVGVGLLGRPRTDAASAASHPPAAMWAPLLAFAAAAVAVAALPAAVGALLAPGVAVAAPTADAAGAGVVLAPLAVLLPLLAGATALVLGLRGATARRARERASDTWGCGYPSPTPAMQYSSTSFGEPITRVFDPLLRVQIRREQGVAPGSTGIWPDTMRWTSRTADRALASLFLPAVARIGRAAEWVRDRYEPRVSTSLVYIVLTAVALLALLLLPVRP